MARFTGWKIRSGVSLIGWSPGVMKLILFPRIRKYFPTEYGYLGYSTVVNNVETFAKAARIIELGADFFTNIGTNNSKGTKILS